MSQMSQKNENKTWQQPTNPLMQNDSVDEPNSSSSLPNMWWTGPAPPKGSSCCECIKHICYWNRNLSYLDQPCKGNAFRQHGVHYVQWSDALFNFAARPNLGWKTLWILLVCTLTTANSVYDAVTFLNINDGMEKDVLSLLAIGMTYLIGVRISLSYDRYYEARKKWGMMVNRSRDIVRQFHGYLNDAKDPGKKKKKNVFFSVFGILYFSIDRFFFPFISFHRCRVAKRCYQVDHCLCLRLQATLEVGEKSACVASDRFVVGIRDFNAGSQ